jgi:hypothetical protein
MIRRTPLRRTRMAPWHRPADDKVTPAVANYVLARDSGCVMRGFEDPCGGRLELDHVDNGGTGHRGPSTKSNLVSLCSEHHRYKTEHARLVRPLLRAYLSRVEPS